LSENISKMASEQKFVDFIIDQMGMPEQITYKKMFGEYGLYFDNKLFALVCDNKLYIKPTQAGRDYIKDVVEAPPYLGAKPSFLIEEQLDDHVWLRRLVTITVKELPEPKPKKK
jgi:TfoX/Sxy family transcriptional regulator of competence genes